MEEITSEQWQRFEEDGYLPLGRVLDDAELNALRSRVDDIMLGRADVDYDELLMQLDGSPAQTNGWKGSTLGYRKIQGLEADRVFAAYLSRPEYRELCRRVYGPVPVSCFRAMLLNKPANAGTVLGWHQDRWTHLDRDPLLTIWTALDPSTEASGAVRIVPGSHRRGLLNPDDPSGFLTDQLTAEHCGVAGQRVLEVDAGEAVLLHNWLLHFSPTNTGPTPRRAFSVCYMDARTTHRDTGRPYPTVWAA